MKQVTIKGEIHSLKGELISKGSELKFRAKDASDTVVNSFDYNGYKIISVFPDINTRICDLQTMEISKLAAKWDKVMFISMTTDAIDVINMWCAAKGVHNIEIWSDKELGEFGAKTNALIPSIGKLARGFIIMKGNQIIDLHFKEELSEMPDFDLVEKFLTVNQ